MSLHPKSILNVNEVTLINNFIIMTCRSSTGQNTAGWWFGTCVIFHFIYEMSSFPLMNSIIFQDGKNHQPEILFELDQVLITNNHY